MKLTSTITKEWYKKHKKLLWAIVLFCLGTAIFRAVYALIGERVYGYRVTYTQDFFLYTLYGIFLFFIYFFWDRLTEKTIQKEKKKKYLLFTIACLGGILFYPAKNSYITEYYAVLISAYVVQYAGAFIIGYWCFPLSVLKKFRWEIGIAFLMSALLTLVPFFEDRYWRPLSATTFWCIERMMSLFRVAHVIDRETFMIGVHEFYINIGPSCAGIMSYAAFTALFLFMIAILLGQQKKLRLYRIIISFIIGLLFVAFINTLRILLILLVGAYINQYFAINLFHTAIGAILFLVFFFWYSGVITRHIIAS